MKRMVIIAALVLSAVSSVIVQQQSTHTRDAASTEQAVQADAAAGSERIRADHRRHHRASPDLCR
jgi:hypothetical protein